MSTDSKQSTIEEFDDVDTADRSTGDGDDLARRVDCLEELLEQHVESFSRALDTIERITDDETTSAQHPTDADDLRGYQ